MLFPYRCRIPDLEALAIRHDPGRTLWPDCTNRVEPLLEHCAEPPRPAVLDTTQLIRQAGPYRYAILDHDSTFDKDVIAFLEATGLKAKRTSVHAPWQNGTAERWIGSCRREVLDCIIPVNEEQ